MKFTCILHACMHNIFIVRSLQVTDRFSMDVSTRDNISYGTVMMPPNHSKGDDRFK